MLYTQIIDLVKAITSKVACVYRKRRVIFINDTCELPYLVSIVIMYSCSTRHHAGYVSICSCNRSTNNIWVNCKHIWYMVYFFFLSIDVWMKIFLSCSNVLKSNMSACHQYLCKDMQAKNIEAHHIIYSSTFTWGFCNCYANAIMGALSMI